MSSSDEYETDDEEILTRARQNYEKGYRHQQRTEYALAAAKLEAAVEGMTKVLGKDSHETAGAMLKLALLYRKLGVDKRGIAEKLYEEAVAVLYPERDRESWRKRLRHPEDPKRMLESEQKEEKEKRDPAKEHAAWLREQAMAAQRLAGIGRKY